MSKPFTDNDLRHIFKPLHERLSRKYTRHKTYLGEFAVVVSLFYMNVMGKKGYANVLKGMAADLHEALEWESYVPSPAALSQARRKVPDTRLRALLHELYDHSHYAKKHPNITFQHHRLVAVDGTDIELPSDDRLRKHFSVHNNGHAPADGKAPPHAGMVVLQDISHDLPIDFCITKSVPNERDCLLRMLDRLRPGDVVIADRGFPSKEVFHSLADMGVDCIMRIPKNTLKSVDAFRQSGDAHAIIEIDTTDSKGRKNVRSKPLKMRLVRDESPSAHGEPRIFATTLLDTQRYRAEDICFCYNRRWRIETAYKEMKIYDGLERIQARTPEGVLQEISAVVIFQILLSELAGLVRHHHPEATRPVKVACHKPDPSRMSARTPDRAPDYWTVTAWECPYNFNRQLMRTCMQGLMKFALAEEYDKAAESLESSVVYLWRLKQKRREGRSASRRPKSANAKNRTQRRSADNKRLRKGTENA